MQRTASGALQQVFTVEGQERYISHLNSYNLDLLDLSVRIAKRSNADIVSAHHVDRANEALISGSSSWVTSALTVFGGILAGIGGSAGIGLLSTKDHHTLLVVLMLIGLVVGVAMVVGAIKFRAP